MRKNVEIKFEVTIDANKIVEAYPNFRYSFCNIDEFIEMISDTMITSVSGGIENTMEKFGYDITRIG